MKAQDSSGTVDRPALAQEIIVSAGNMLRAAGFNRAEIGDFFRQAADLLAPAAPPSPAPSGTLDPGASDQAALALALDQLAKGSGGLSDKVLARLTAMAAATKG